MRHLKVFLLLGLMLSALAFHSFAEVGRTVEIFVGQRISLASFSVESGIMKPSSAKWSSSDTKVVSVSSDGQITALSPGQAVVTATLNEGNTIKQASITIKVNSGVKAISLTNSQQILRLAVGGTNQLKYSVELVAGLSKSYKEGVVWTSVDNSVATVSADGTVKGLKPGRVMIYITTNDGGVRDYVYFDVYGTVTGLKVLQPEITMNVGEKQAMGLIFSPENAVLKDCRYQLTESGIVTVDSQGLITAKKEGTTYVTATSLDGGYTASMKISVKSMVKGILVEPRTLNFNDLNKTQQLTATLVPATEGVAPVEKGIYYYSGDSRIVNVSSSGMVTAVGRGISYIRVVSADGGFEAGVYVNSEITDNSAKVYTATAMKVDPLPSNLVVGKSYEIGYTVSPSNATDKNVTAAVLGGKAKVEVKNGKLIITPYTSGRTFIEVKHAAGFKETLDFQVNPSVTGLGIVDELEAQKDKLLYLYLGQKVTLTGVYQPAGTLTEQELMKIPGSWSADSALTLTNDSNDYRRTILKANQLGGGTVSFKSEAQGLTSSLQVIVEGMVKDLKLPTTVKLGISDPYLIQAEFILKDQLRYPLTTVQDSTLMAVVEQYYVNKGFLEAEIQYEEENLANLSKQRQTTGDADLLSRVDKAYSAHFLRRELFRMWLSKASGDYAPVEDPSKLTDRDLNVLPFFKLNGLSLSSPVSGKAVVKVTSKDGNISKLVTVEVSDQNKELVLLDAAGNIVSISSPEVEAALKAKQKELELAAEKARIAALKAKLPISGSDMPSDSRLEIVVKAYDKGILSKANAKKLSGNLSRTDAAELLIKLFEKLSGKALKKIPMNYYVDSQSEFVNKAYTLGLFGSLPKDRKFQPNSSVNVAEASQWLVKAAKASKAKLDPKVISAIENWGKTGKGYVTKEQFIELLMKLLP